MRNQIDVHTSSLIEAAAKLARKELLSGLESLRDAPTRVIARGYFERELDKAAEELNRLARQISDAARGIGVANTPDSVTAGNAEVLRRKQGGGK